MGQLEEALTAFERAHEHNPILRWALTRQAVVYANLGRIEEARPVLDELRTLWTRPMSELRSELIERHIFSPDVADRLLKGAARAGLEGL